MSKSGREAISTIIWGKLKVFKLLEAMYSPSDTPPGRTLSVSRQLQVMRACHASVASISVLRFGKHPLYHDSLQVESMRRTSRTVSRQCH